MTRGKHFIRVTVELIGDGFTSKISSKQHEMISHVTLGKHARFALAEALENAELANWTTGGEPRFRPTNKL